MEFKHGQRVMLRGSPSHIRHSMHFFSAELYKQGKRLLIIDTVNSLNPHHPCFSDPQQHRYFKNIHCVRTPLPYDLWARLGTTGGFIKKRKINVLLITSLSLIFKDASLREVEPMVKNILRRVDFLTETHQLITLIGNSPSENEPSLIASLLLSEEPHVLEAET